MHWHCFKALLDTIVPFTGSCYSGCHFVITVVSVLFIRLTDVRTSINRRQNTVTQYIATQPLLDLCEEATNREGVMVTLMWWEQSGIDWEKAKAKETETELASDLGSETESITPMSR